jgi:hypothetical protein
MRTYTGTDTVTGGYYLNRRELKLEVIEGENGVLPGDEKAVYVRVPGPAMLVVAPLLGLAFVVVMPFLGVAVLLEQGARKLGVVARREPGKAAVNPAPRR